MTTYCKGLKNRINRISGQINGIEKMFDTNRDAIDIVQQISAVRSALSQLAVEVLKEESNECLSQSSKEQKIKKFEILVKNFFKMN